MADIYDINGFREFKRRLLPIGTIIDGVTLSSAENFYSYVEYDDSINVKKLESDLTTDDWNSLLSGAKLVRIGDMSEEFNEFLEGGFEYPVSSNNWFSINESARGYLVNMSFSSASLSYPVTYTGIGESEVILNNATDVNNLYGAALTAHETERATRELPAINSIKAVTGSPVDGSTIDQVFAINY
jgi:hypothetical protein